MKKKTMDVNTMSENRLLDIAEIWIKEIKKLGLLDSVDNDVIEQIKLDYANRLEDIMIARTLDKLEELGKLEEYEVVLDDNNADVQVWLQRNIPGYDVFVLQVIAEAKAKIIGR